MTEEVNKEEGNAVCVRCHTPITCLPHDISRCPCNKVVLTTEEYRYINSQFQNCVCNGCLEELKTEYHSKHHFNRPDNSVIRKYNSILIGILFSLQISTAQNFEPGVGQPGTSAMFKDSSAFVGWASACTLSRGYQNVSDHSLGFASAGDNSMATGKAQSNGVVSLGDGGEAVCTFLNPISNGPGYDFAVFENSFDDSFLELAFVEVSSDGQNFFRFYNQSLTDTLTQTASFGPTDPTKIHNLAGKYRGGYGTPFDLAELSGVQGLNINAITHVKVVDVVGSINSLYAKRDSNGRMVNDPWPTPFPSGGFDLDAVGVIHENTVAGLVQNTLEAAVCWPNPVSAGDFIQVRLSSADLELVLTDQLGRILVASQSNQITTAGISPGAYFLTVKSEEGAFMKRVLIF